MHRSRSPLYVLQGDHLEVHLMQTLGSDLCCGAQSNINHVRTRKFGHFVCRTNQIVICNDCLAAGAQSDALIRGLARIRSTQESQAIFYGLPCLTHQRLQLNSVIG